MGINLCAPIRYLVMMMMMMMIWVVDYSISRIHIKIPLKIASKRIIFIYWICQILIQQAGYDLWHFLIFHHWFPIIFWTSPRFNCTNKLQEKITEKKGNWILISFIDLEARFSNIPHCMVDCCNPFNHLAIYMFNWKILTWNLFKLIISLLFLRKE